MASSLRLLVLLVFVIDLVLLSHAQSSFARGVVVLPLTKHASTLQYVTTVHYGTPPVPVDLVVDLGGPFFWLDCASKLYGSSSRRPIRCLSIQCSAAKARDCGDWRWSARSRTTTCRLVTENAVTGAATSGELAEDVVFVQSRDGSESRSILTVDHFVFSCAPDSLLKGLASGVNGMLGLGRTRIALPSQLSTAIGLPQKFAICLSSSSEGAIFVGDGDGLPIPGVGTWNSLMYTPLISKNQLGETLQEYYINVTSISINGKRLPLNASLLTLGEEGFGGTKISTVVPYTLMESSIYDTFTRAFIDSAAAMNMTSVASVVPFGACFSSHGGGLSVPAVDLVLQSELVKWSIHGRNSMVQVSDEVMCLGVLEGGLRQRASIVIGGYQLEDNLLQFDVGASRLGFSSLLVDTTCSNFKYSTS